MIMTWWIFSKSDRGIFLPGGRRGRACGARGDPSPPRSGETLGFAGVLLGEILSENCTSRGVAMAMAASPSPSPSPSKNKTHDTNANNLILLTISYTNSGIYSFS